ncbi:MAG: M28 family peptidase [Pyrinomonadaceae bacterium]
MKQFLKFLSIVLFSASGLIAQGSLANAPSSKLFDAAKLIHDLRQLSSDEMEGRSADLPSMQKARDYVERRLGELGVSPFGSTFKQEFEFAIRRSTSKLKGVNFVGEVKGKTADKYIVISAHYDHDGIRDGKIYNGADDNASGTAALFAIAEYFRKHKPSHSLIFAVFDAEEKGLVGSRHFVQNLPVNKEKIVLNINLDMVSRGDKGELYAAGTFLYPTLMPAMKVAQKKASVTLLLGHDDPKLGRDDWTNQSDHASFHREKIPFIYFGVEDHPDYHTPTDDFEKVPQAFYVKAVETIIEAIKALDKSSGK